MTYRKMLLIPLLLAFTAGATPATQPETVAQLEARLKALKTQVAEVEGKLAAARAKESPGAVELGAILDKVPPHLAWKQGESARTAGERGDWIIEQARGPLLRVTIVVSRGGTSGSFVDKAKHPYYVNLEPKPDVKFYEGDSIVVTGQLVGAEPVGGGTDAGYRLKLQNLEVQKVIPKR